MKKLDFSALYLKVIQTKNFSDDLELGLFQ